MINRCVWVASAMLWLFTGGLAAENRPIGEQPSANPVAITAELNVRDFGAVGDGVVDDTVAIQAAIDAAGVRGGTLRFPPGTYLVTSVGLHPGVHYLGYGATILRPPDQGKWTRTFNAAKRGYQYSGDVDSAPLVVEGLTFDGNRVAQGEYRQYELEQAHLLFLSADASKPGRLRARIVNCDFQENVADAISLYVNVDVQIVNCRARDCFRGGLVITGGNSRIQVVNFTAEGKTEPTGIDVEVDGRGYGGTHRIELTICGLFLPDGDFDIGVSDGSVVLGHNIVARAPFYILARDSMIRLSDSLFGVGRLSSYSNRIVFPHDVTFQNCRFQVESKIPKDQPTAVPDTTGPKVPAPVEGDPPVEPTPGKWAAAHVYWNIRGTNHRDQNLRFLDCDFMVAPDIPAEDETYAIFCEATRAANNNRLLVQGGSIASNYTYGVYIRQGGTLTLRDMNISARTPLHLGSVASRDYLLKALVDGVQTDGALCYAVIPSHGTGNRITHRNVELDESTNILKTRYGLTGNEYRGGRLIYGTLPPTAATHGLIGDYYRLKKATPGLPAEWRCTRAGIGSGAIWKEIP